METNSSGGGSSSGSLGSSSTMILHNAVIVTMDKESRVFRNGGVFVVQDRIKAIGQSADILQQFSQMADQIIDLQSQILLPGFVNTHVHTSQQLAKGIADDVDLMTWLHDRIWPYESNMTEEDSYISTLLCGIELIHSGVTCFAEAGGQHVSEMAKAVELLGLRACLVQSTMDCGEGLPASWAVRTTDDCIQHVAEIPYENQVVMDTRKVDHGTVTFLDKIEFLQNNLLSAHTVWVNHTEIGLLSRAGVKVSHCPASAMRMLGFAPIKEMLHADICVSLGTDGAPSNNRMSIVDEMYLASLINKGREVFANGTTDPAALPAETVLRMATINGAKSVLWDNDIGSLEAGKKADMVVVDPFSWPMVPVHDRITSLVYCMRTENVVSVMCNGQWVMKNKKILTVDEREIISAARQASDELLKRAGITIPNRMNVL
ncbi:UDP-glucose 6-dehydrogenase 3 [Citrus sinensis]|uniref:UDP-glucose 6-dehydrogenase 3 n=1 Tax=Citrus sinensis TaxID=2711 RepID=A0ACB8LLK2_CITSI|nr:UDP-glucose 6-dehydrogenase 3 [Citrus sinensis]